MNSFLITYIMVPIAFSALGYVIGVLLWEIWRDRDD